MAAVSPCARFGAAADVINAAWIDSNQFNCRILHMPDLDQRRSDLPNNGNMYCVPTAAINLFAYAANHGFPFVYPGPGPWQAQSKYDDATSAIQLAGLLMGTTPLGGTNGDGAIFGYTMLAGASPILTSKNEFLSGWIGPNMPQIAKLVMQGWIVSFGYGRYDLIDVPSGPYYRRDGGHAITFTGAGAAFGNRSFRARDPADDSNLTTQSAFADRQGSWAIELRKIQGIDGLRLMTVLNPGQSPFTEAMIDSLSAIRPKFGMSFAPTGADPNEPPKIKLHDPAPLLGSVNLIPSETPLPPGSQLADMAFHPQMTDLLLLLKEGPNPAKLFIFDPVTGAMNHMPEEPLDLKRIAVSRKGPIFGFDSGGKLYRMSPHDGAVLNAQSSLPPPAALAADDANDAVWILSVAQRRLVRFGETLGPAQVNWLLPPEVPLAGDGSVTVNPVTGKPYLCTEGSDSIFGVTQNPDGPIEIETISLPGIIRPRALQFGPTGELMVICDGSVRVLRFIEESGWQIDTSDPFHGIEARAPFIITPARSNFEPELHSGPGWYDLPPESLLPIGDEVVDCDGDLNGDHVVDGADLGILLGLWGGPGTLADLNTDGVVNGDDLGTLLGFWGPCP